MWIFTKHGFFSAVCARQGAGKHGEPVDLDRIMVRARVRDHLEALRRRSPDLLGACDVQEFAGTDYAYRIFVDKGVCSQVLSRLADETDFDNFKSEVARHQTKSGRRSRRRAIRKSSRAGTARTIVALLALVLLAIGALRWHWGIRELSALFFGLAVVAGPVGRLSLDETAKSFIQGAADLTYAGLVVGLARSILVILRDAQVMDTMTHALAATIRHWPSSISAVGIYVIQNLLHFFVPSGSGQAAVSMPILAPLGDLLGITRQTNVLAYQLGNGLTNVFIPTQGYFMAARLGILGIPWSKSVRWLLPLLLVWAAIGCAAVLIAQAIRWGPF